MIVPFSMPPQPEPTRVPMELKYCEFCGAPFTRVVPQSAKDGDKYCQSCKACPPNPDEEMIVTRSYHVMLR